MGCVRAVFLVDAFFFCGRHGRASQAIRPRQKQRRRLGQGTVRQFLQQCASAVRSQKLRGDLGHEDVQALSRVEADRWSLRFRRIGSTRGKTRRISRQRTSGRTLAIDADRGLDEVHGQLAGRQVLRAWFSCRMHVKSSLSQGAKMKNGRRPLVRIKRSVSHPKPSRCHEATNQSPIVV